MLLYLTAGPYDNVSRSFSLLKTLFALLGSISTLPGPGHGFGYASAYLPPLVTQHVIITTIYARYSTPTTQTNQREDNKGKCYERTHHS